LILTGREEDTTEIVIECSCGCEALKLSKWVWQDENTDYFLEIIAPAFYTEQHGSWDRFKTRAKFIWLILRGKYHWLTSLTLKREHLVELRDALNKMIEE